MITATLELAAFLRTRRERLDPRDFGLPVRRSRRTPGLRREEVAELAGVSVDYVVRLEQARGLRPSAAVVEALSGALRLTEEERAYFFDLTGQRPRGTGEPATAAEPSLARLVEDLSPLPVMLLNHRFDILAWNEEMAHLLLDFAELPPSRRNAMWLCLLHPEVREYYVDRERVVREGINHLRTAWAAHPDDPVLTALIAECTDGNEEFARLWAERDVRGTGRGSKVLRHPAAGVVAVDFEVLVPLRDAGQRLLIGRPADDASRAALRSCAGSPG
ncbi:helix-turn-helix transcriptional regulator [Amycolatopsis sp. NPDC004747]